MAAPEPRTVELTVPADAGIAATVRGEVATVTLDRPERLNAQTPHTWAALAAVSAALPPDVRVVVLRGAGRSFSAGLDKMMFAPDGIEGIPGILALAAGTMDEASEQIGHWQRAFDWTSRADVVSVAAVQGHAIGGGFQLALGADIRILADDAMLSMAEAKLGIVPDLGGTKRLVDLVGYSRAAEICLTGRRIPADEALRIGLASAVVAPAELDAAVERTVTALLAVDRGASTATKQLLQAAGTRTQDEQQRAEREAQYLRLRALAAMFG